MTYKNCKKLIENKIKTCGVGQLDQNWASDMLNKLDVFLLADRVTDEQYQELTGLIDRNLQSIT